MGGLPVVITPASVSQWKPAPPSDFRAVAIWALLGALLTGAILKAEDSRNAALRQILGDEAFLQSAGETCRRTRSLEPAARYAALLHAVIPAANQLHLEVEFSPTHPAPILEDMGAVPGRRGSTGGQLVSPALDLVDAADAVHQLDELRTTVEAIHSRSLPTQKSRSALLILIHLQRKDTPAAFQEFDQFSRLCAEPQSPDQRDRASELVVFERCQNDPQLREVALPLIERIVGQHRMVYEQSVWSRQVKTRRVLTVPAPQNAIPMPQAGLAQWQPASMLTAKTRGMGIPDTQWFLSPGRADNLVSHGHDYLYFASPLVGSYQIECDATSFNWLEARLFAGGVWVSPTYDLQHYEYGGFEEVVNTQNIEPPLSQTYDMIHLRMSVDPQATQGFANGRLIHTQPTLQSVDPWLGIRSGLHVEGSVFNVRVTGKPEIPATIDLTTSASLNGWIAYFQETGESNRWQKTPDGIVGMHDARPEQSNTPVHREEALFYHRPMFEDGTIEYEFFYQQAAPSDEEGAQSAHVALDRLCLLMQPEGVAVHWLTDGRFDRTEIAPDNAVIVPEHQRSQGRLPLKNRDWNSAALTVKGDSLQLTLNGELIFERPIESTNQRQFGFFHFADQDALQVRNVRWTGDWPKTLPTVLKQPLAVPEGELLDQDQARLTNVFEQNFAQDGMPEERFVVVHGKRGQNFSTVEDGVKVTMAGTGPTQYATLAPAIQIQGDFDVMAEYDHFMTAPPAMGGCTVMLLTALDNPTRDEAFITRSHNRPSATKVDQMTQSVIVAHTPEGEKQDYFTTNPMEERSGRLRLARRGGKMFYLSAEGHSENFRLRGTRDVGRDPVQMNGVRLVSQVTNKSSSAVVWKQVTVRAEKITGDGTGELDPRIVELNQQRAQLPVHVTFDLTAAEPASTAAYRWGDLRPWNKANGGLPLRAVGTKDWTSSGIALQNPIAGDFDFQAVFEVKKLAKPAPGGGSSIFLQLEGADELQTQIGAIFSLTDDGTTEFSSQVRTRVSDGTLSYRNDGRLIAKHAIKLRVARRGRIVTVLGTPDGTAHERVISRFESHDSVISNSKILLHTGGPDLISDILLKSLSVDAGRYSPNPAALNGAKP